MVVIGDPPRTDVNVLAFVEGAFLTIAHQVILDEPLTNGLHPPSGNAPRLQHLDAVASFAQLIGRRQTRKSGPEDDHLCALGTAR